jgi:hypothetical protein
LGRIGRDMAKNTLWRELMQDGLWHHVLKHKYYPYASVDRWLHTVIVSDVTGSQTWKHLLKSLHIILHWIAWILGTGHHILFSKDHILRMGEGVVLIEELIIALNRKGIYFLFQAQCEARVGMIGTNWHSNNALGLERDLTLEWNSLRFALINNGVQLLENPDKIIWMGGDASRQLTVKNAYEALEKKNWCFMIGGWRKSMWSWACPLKIHLFTRLMAENNILTWDLLQRRCFHGTIFFHLCKASKEFVYHLFVECSFSMEVWKKVTTTLNLPGRWSSSTIAKCFKSWKEQNLSYPFLPAVICWFI